MIPERSTLGKLALDIFFEGDNDVHFYVEDTRQKNLYKVILGRLFPRLSLAQIFPLDGKNNVLRHIEDVEGNKSIKKPRIYIVDKDFDDILGIMKTYPNLFYLKKYSIENYLLDKNAVMGFVIESAPKTDYETLCSSFKYEELFRKNIAAAQSLFRLFCLAHKHNLPLRNAKYAPEQFTNQKKIDEIDDSKIESYRHKVATELLVRKIINCDTELDELCTSIFPKRHSEDTHISGKFLMKLIKLHLVSKKYIGNIEDDIMLYSLARNTGNTQLKELKMRVRRYLRSTLSDNCM